MFLRSVVRSAGRMRRGRRREAGGLRRRSPSLFSGSSRLVLPGTGDGPVIRVVRRFSSVVVVVVAKHEATQVQRARRARCFDGPRGGVRVRNPR